MSNNQKVKVEFDKVIGISAAATLLDIDGQTYWIPDSKVSDSSGFKAGDTDVWLVIPYWLADEKDLLDYAEDYE